MKTLGILVAGLLVCILTYSIPIRYFYLNFDRIVLRYCPVDYRSGILPYKFYVSIALSVIMVVAVTVIFLFLVDCMDKMHSRKEA